MSALDMGAWMGKFKSGLLSGQRIFLGQLDGASAGSCDFSSPFYWSSRLSPYGADIFELVISPPRWLLVVGAKQLAQRSVSRTENQVVKRTQSSRIIAAQSRDGWLQKCHVCGCSTCERRDIDDLAPAYLISLRQHESESGKRGVASRGVVPSVEDRLCQRALLTYICVVPVGLTEVLPLRIIFGHWT